MLYKETMTRRPLTDLQKRVLDFISARVSDAGMPPTREEMCEHFGWTSHNSAQQHLRLIEAKGYIRLLNGKRARGIQIL